MFDALRLQGTTNELIWLARLVNEGNKSQSTKNHDNRFKPPYGDEVRFNFNKDGGRALNNAALNVDGIARPTYSWVKLGRAM